MIEILLSFFQLQTVALFSSNKEHEVKQKRLRGKIKTELKSDEW